MNVKSAAFISCLAVSALLSASCDVRYDLVTFHSAGLMPAATSPVPRIDIETHVTAGMMGGAVRSNKPYDIRAWYLDDTFTFASAEFTKVTVTYADGSVDPGTTALKLPIHAGNAIHESSNSMAGGAVVIRKSRIIRAEFPAVIHRDEDFTLLIEGTFTKEDGSTIPFTIREKYDVAREKKTESWADFVSGC